MADNSILQRSYRISDGELALFSNTLASVMTRDLAEFANYSVTNLVIDDFKDLIDEFQAMPVDEILRADLSYAVEQRDLKRHSILNIMRSLSARGKAVFGDNSSKYRSLSPGTISQMTESNLLIAARQVHTAAVSSLAELAAEGVTAPYLAAFSTLTDDFETAIDDVNNKKNLRDNATEAKILKGNELYKLVVKYCDYGKLIWEGISPAKYNDYIIYTSVSPGPITAPANLRYNTQYLKVEWDAVENATSYQLDVSTDGVNFSELVTTSDPEFSYIPYDAHTFFRVRSRNANGFSDYSNIIDFWYYEPLPAPANFVAELIPGHQYKLSWDLVHSVTSYKIYISDVPFGDPESVFAPLYETSALEYTGAITAGRRYYFKITSNNNYQPESAYSSTEYVEVTGV